MFAEPFGICRQPVFQGDYPGWSFEPGCSGYFFFHEGERGRVRSGSGLAEAPNN
jgi:hypothetical protein